MTRNYLTLCAAAGLVCACSAPAKLAFPDGRTRGPVNTDAAIAAYMSSGPKAKTSSYDEGETARQPDSVRREIANLKMHLSAQLPHPDDGRDRKVETPTSAPASALPLATNPAPGSDDGDKAAETIKLSDQSITFRMTLGKGISDFNPSPWFEEALLRAAKNGTRIDIRGGSDENTRSHENEMVAKARATNARDYLVSHGISPDLVHTKYFPAGGFVADNSTPQGKRQNRRIDIEVTQSSSISRSATNQTGASQ